MHTVYDAAVIGGGVFGCVIARHFRQRFPRVVLLEQRTDLLQRASYANQARVHHGYHYPRHLPTAARSAANYRRFLTDFADCIDRSFAKYYAIGRQFSKVQASYFESFCRRIGAPCRPAEAAVASLFEPDYVEAVFEVEECAFNAIRLKELLVHELATAGVEVRRGITVRRVRRGGAGRLRLTCEGHDGPAELEAGHAFNCTYAQLNHLLLDSDLPLLPLKSELAELALVEVPDALRRVGVTLMCGPFFSCMPFPAVGLHSLSHVRYTPHTAWREEPGQPRAAGPPAGRGTNFPWMVRDAARYLPLLAGCRYRQSLWEVKVVLCANEGNDGRPILFQRDHGLPGLHCILGGKLDNLFDMLDELDLFLAAPRAVA
jgi:glycine/D-amino acid oxidase-like deaminating enzyme